MSVVATKLVSWREKHGLTQREAAAKCGISQFSWSSLETGSYKRLGLGIAARVVAGTKGAVTMRDLVALALAS